MPANHRQDKGVNMLQFYETRMGRKFFEADIPALIRSTERLAIALEQQKAKNTEAIIRLADIYVRAKEAGCTHHRMFSLITQHAEELANGSNEETLHGTNRTGIHGQGNQRDETSVQPALRNRGQRVVTECGARRKKRKAHMHVFFSSPL